MDLLNNLRTTLVLHTGERSEEVAAILLVDFAIAIESALNSGHYGVSDNATIRSLLHDLGFSVQVESSLAFGLQWHVMPCDKEAS